MDKVFQIQVLFMTLGYYLTHGREFRIAWMAPKREYYNLSAASSVGGLKLALVAMRKNNYVVAPLANHTVRVKWFYSDCNSKSALAATVDAKDQWEPDVFLGPPCSEAMKGVAELASHWNIPVFGWVSQDEEFKNKQRYSTLVRFLGPLNNLPIIMSHVSVMFKWKLFSMIHDSGAPYRAVADAISGTKEYIIKSTHEVNPRISDDILVEIFSQIRKYSRIIIFAVPWNSMRKYMLVAHRLGMTGGDFAFICIHGDLYTWEILDEEIFSDRVWRRNDSLDEVARVAFEPVLHVMMDTLTDKGRYEQFKLLAMQYGGEDTADWVLPKAIEPDAYAPYLYDATLMWALLADKALQEGKQPKNGSLMFTKSISFSQEGLTGEIMLDENADRLLNFMMIDMMENGTFQQVLSIKFSHKGMALTVTNNASSKQTITRWPNGKYGINNAPRDIPICGFDGEFCQPAVEESDKTDIISGAAAGSAFVFVIAIVVNITLKRYRRLKNLKSLIWQVRFEEIDFVTALLNGSIRASFKNLGRRKSSGNKKKYGQLNGGNGGNAMSTIARSPDNSPAQFHKLDNGTMFGSVAYLKSILVSVKRVAKNSYINLTNIPKNVLQELNQLMELKHQNVCAFVGACIDPGRILLLWEYCPKGSIQDVIWNQNIKLDRMFMFALSQDIAKGLDFIHKSSVHYHGNLKSSNCVVDSRWTCKLVDFGVPTIRELDKVNAEDCQEKFLWTAPEILRTEKNIDKQKADIYSLGVILKEIFSRSGPYTEYPFLGVKDILAKVTTHPPGTAPFRPMLSMELKQSHDLTVLIEECWNEIVISRPTAGRVVKTLNRINPSKNMTMIDNMIAILEKHANHLEELVADRTSELDAEKKKTENLLYRMLPKSVAEDLKLGKPIEAEQFDDATIYFSDIVGFTSICAASTPIEVVDLLNRLYTLFDDIITRYDVYKVETIGDAYMLASGLPKRNGHRHIREIADCALDIMASIGTFNIPHQHGNNLRIRVGMHSGPVVAGVVGLAMPRYCLFGDTVNTASRMESTGLPLKVHLSSSSKDRLEKYEGYHLFSRGEITVKGKGIMKTYFLMGKEGFSKDLPKIEEEDYHLFQSPSISSDINSICNGTPPTTPRSISNTSDLTIDSVVFEDKDRDDKETNPDRRRKRSRKTSVVEVTSL